MLKFGSFYKNQNHITLLKQRSKNLIANKGILTFDIQIKQDVFLKLQFT